MAADGPTPRAPQHRPTWLVLVAAIMVISAARMGLVGLLSFTDQEPSSAPQTALIVSAEDAAARAVDLAMKAVRAGHPTLVQAHAVAQVAISLLLLYVVAAVFTLDARGRRLALWAGWVGVLYHVGNVIVGLAVLRPAIMNVAPTVVAQLGASPETPGLDYLVPALRALSVALPLMTGAAGLAFSAIVLTLFGGRRGRILYGLEPQPPQGAT